MNTQTIDHSASYFHSLSLSSSSCADSCKSLFWSYLIGINLFCQGALLQHDSHRSNPHLQQPNAVRLINYAGTQHMSQYLFLPTRFVLRRRWPKGQRILVQGNGRHLTQQVTLFYRVLHFKHIVRQNFYQAQRVQIQLVQISESLMPQIISKVSRSKKVSRCPSAHLQDCFNSSASLKAGEIKRQIQ